MYAKSRTLFAVSEIELVYRNKLKPEDRLKINDVDTAYNILITAWDMNKIELVEQFYIMLLDNRGACLGISNVATGGTCTCIADPKVIFATALKARASRIILAHNHPSGNLEPSKSDINLTNKLCMAGRYLDITIDDHLIVTPHDYLSFEKRGYMP